MPSKFPCLGQKKLKYNATYPCPKGFLQSFIKLRSHIIPQCEGIPRRNWTGKCVVLQNASGATMAEGIYGNVSSNDVIGSSGPLGDSHVAVQISSSLSEIDVPDEWRYSV